MTDFDVHPEGYSNGEALSPVEMMQGMLNPRIKRNPQEDLHIAIDLAYALAIQLKELHPLAEKQIKAMIFQGNLLEC